MAFTIKPNDIFRFKKNGVKYQLINVTTVDGKLIICCKNVDTNVFVEKPIEKLSDLIKERKLYSSGTLLN